MARAPGGRRARRPSASLSVSVGGRPSGSRGGRTPTVRRYVFGYCPARPRRALRRRCWWRLPFLFSLYLALSDASVGEPVARFVGLENFTAALENGTFWTALRNSAGLHDRRGHHEGPARHHPGVSPAPELQGKKIVRGARGDPVHLPIAISVLGWKWMYDSQFSVINWALSRLDLIGAYGTARLAGVAGRSRGLALLSVHVRQRLARFPFRRSSSCAGMTSVPPEVSTPPRSTAAPSCSGSTRWWCR